MALKYQNGKAHPFFGLINGRVNRTSNRRKNTNLVTFERSRVRSLGAAFNGTTGVLSKTSKTPSIA